MSLHDVIPAHRRRHARQVLELIPGWAREAIGRDSDRLLPLIDAALLAYLAGRPLEQAPPQQVCEVIRRVIAEDLRGAEQAQADPPPSPFPPPQGPTVAPTVPGVTEQEAVQLLAAVRRVLDRLDAGQVGSLRALDDVARVILLGVDTTQTQ